MSKQRNQILLLIFIFLVGGLFAYSHYLFLPKWTELMADTKQLEQRQAYLTKLEESAKIIPSLQEQAIALETRVSALDIKVPKKLDKPDIMLNIYNMAKANGLTPQNLIFDHVKDEGEFYTMGMNFTCKGSAENVYTLLDQFSRSNQYIFALESISLNPAAETGFLVDMRIVAYTYK